jgi:regulatory protein
MTEARKGRRTPKNVHDRALGLLGVRARSRMELHRRLLQAGFEEEEVREELDRLERVGLVDDEAFARQIVDHAFQSRLESRRVAAGRLASAGVSRETAARVLEEMDGEEEDRALALASAKAARLKGILPEKAYSRLTGLLARRGYAPEIARKAARKALAIEGVEE